MIPMVRDKNWKSPLMVLAVMSVIFLALYHSFLFGGQLYAYTDVGADTIDQYLPMTVFEVDALREGTTEQYSLQYGLGRFLGGTLMKYLNPVNLPLLLCAEEYLNVGLMISLYLKYAVICLFALFFFRRLLKQERAACVCALLWTFSGYAVLWGQHYQFLTGIAAFTVAVYGFQLFLEDSHRWYLVIPAVAYLASTGYYYLYIGCYFFLGYGVLYLAFQGRGLKAIAKKAGGFALVMIAAACIAGASLIPAVVSFFSSARVEQVAAGIGGEPVLYSKNVLMAMLSRLFSNNLFGVGDEFLGPTNYYECAILSVSLLFVFAFVYLMQGKNWKRVLGITTVCALLACMPGFSRLIVFSSAAQRWTYLLCFAEVIAIGSALADLCRRWNEAESRKRLLRTVLLTDGLLAFAMAVLYLYHIQVGGWLLNEKAVITLAVIVALYHIGLAVMTRSRRAFAILMALVAAELVLNNYATVNDRKTPSVEQWETELYNDGTREVVRWIQQRDDSLYRIGKTYWSVHYCDSLIQDYNGVGIYNSTNSAELLALAEAYGYTWAGNRVGFDGTDLLTNSMLGVKYVIAQSGEALNPDYYEKIYDDGSHAVYENLYWLGFGWWQDEDPPLTEGTGLEKLEELTRTASSAKTIDLLPYLTHTENCRIEGCTVTGTGARMRLAFDAPELEEGWLVSGLRVKMTAQAGSNAYLLVSTEDSGFSWDHYDVQSYGAGSVSFSLDNTLTEPLTGIQLEISLACQQIGLEALELVIVDGAGLRQSLSAMQAGRVTDLTQQGGVFSGTVTNPGEESALLCLPLVYSVQWEATVDGQAVAVQCFNAGLVGLEVEPGGHEIRLSYRSGVYRLAGAVSAAGTLLFVTAVCLENKRFKYKRKERDDQK